MSPPPYQELVPHPALSPFVDRFWIRRGPGPAESFRVLPDGCADVIVNLLTGNAFVVGTMTRPLVLQDVPAVNTVAVRFRPGAAAAFLGAPAGVLTDLRLPTSELPLAWFNADLLCHASDVMQAAHRLQQSLLDRLNHLAALPVPDPLVAHAVRALVQPEPPRIEALARRIGWSRQHLGRVFRAEVGLGPKELARVARVHRAVTQLQSQTPAPRRRHGTSLVQVAATAGYYDEAHIDRDFRALVGITPRQVQTAVQTAAGSIRPIPSLFAVA